MSNIDIPKEQEIIVDGWVGFKIIVPNGTSIYLINQFLAMAMAWTCIEINKRRPTKSIPYEKPVGTSFIARLRAAFRK